MYTRTYTIKQVDSDGETKSCSFALPSVAKKWLPTFHMSDGTTITTDPIEVQNDVSKLHYKLEIENSNGNKFASYFYVPFGMYKPQITDYTFVRDSTVGSNYASITVYNPNAASVDAVLWYKLNSSENVLSNGTVTIGSKESKTINFTDIYSAGMCIRVNFVSYANGVNENEIFSDIGLGRYDGTYSFYGVEESSSSTTTTTTVGENSLEPTLIESDGKFTLWRKQNVE